MHAERGNGGMTVIMTEYTSHFILWYTTKAPLLRNWMCCVDSPGRVLEHTE